MGTDLHQPPWKKVAWYVVLTALGARGAVPDLHDPRAGAVAAPRPTSSAGPAALPGRHASGTSSPGPSPTATSGRKFLVSAVVTVLIVAGQLVTSILAAYAFAFLRVPVPADPVLRVHGHPDAAHRGHPDPERADHPLPRLAQLLPGAGRCPFLATAFGTFLIRQGFLGIPRDLRDASQLDGFGHLAFLRRVAIPVTRPVVASFAVIAFLAAWNQYTWPRAVVTEGRWETIQIGLQVRRRPTPSTRTTSASPRPSSPPCPSSLLLIFLQRQLVRGLTAGAVKG